MWNDFLTSNSTWWRLARTIVQAIIGVIADYVVVIVAELPVPEAFRPAIVALIMAILSPIMSELGKRNTEIKEIEK